MPATDTPEPRFRHGWLLACGAVWLLVFHGVFFSLGLPNNQGVSRMAVWDALPAILASVIDHSAGSGFQFLAQRFALIGTAGVMLAGAWSLGELLVRVCRVPLAALSVERFVFAAGLGLSASSLLTLAAGLTGKLSVPLFAAVMIPAGVLAVVLLVRDVRSRSAHPCTLETCSTWGTLPACPGWALVLCIAGCFPFLLCILLGACLPSTDFDVNAYHFLGPKEFYQSGRISFLPHNVYTSFPFLTEMLTLQAMVHGDWLWGAVAGKVLLAAYAPLTALAIFAAGRRWFGPIAGVIGAIVYLGTPWTFRISTIAYVEGALSFYLFAALWGTVEAVAALRSEQPAAARSWFLLAGLLSGSAMACKYPGLVSVIIPLGAAAVGSPFLFDRTITPLTDRCRAAAMFGAVFLAGVLLTVGPWLLKNAAETGNPVYPLAYSVFGGRDWDAELDAKWRRAHSAHSFTWNDAIGGLADVSLRNDWLSPLLFGLAPLSLGLLFRPGPQVLVGQVSNLSALSDDDISGRTRALLIAVWLYLLYLIATWWGLTHRIDRFFVPQHPIVALLAGAGVAACLRHTPSRPFVGAALAGVIGTASLFNLGVILSGLAGYNEFLSDLKYADAKARRITAPEIVYLNSHLPKDSKVLCVGDAELFYAEYPVVYNTVFDRSTFEECFGDDPAAISKSEIIRRLKHHGITHVYVNWLEVLRYRTTYGYTDAVMPARFTELQSLKALGPAWSIPEARTLARDPKGRWQLNSAWEQEVQTWGPELLRPIDGQQALVTFQVFPVLQE